MVLLWGSAMTSETPGRSGFSIGKYAQFDSANEHRDSIANNHILLLSYYLTMT